MLGTPPLLGRTFTVGAELSRVEPEVVLSYGLWQRRYGGDPGVIGQPITLDGESFTIIGVTPEGFAVRTVELPESRAELWLPVSLVPDDASGMLGNLSVVARLAPGATIEQARSELFMISERIAEERPVLSGSSQCCNRWFPDVVPLLEATVQSVRLALLVLFGAVDILLLIACSNVANLVLSRAVTRRAELAIRVSLGATLGRLARQLLTESLLLATIGGALGVLLAVWGTGLLVSSLPAGLELPRTREIGVNLTVLGFVFLTTILATALIGLLPSLISMRSARQPLLGQAMRGHRFDHGPSRLRHALIISEVALALALLAGGGLLARSFLELNQVDPGFQQDYLLTMRTTLPASQYDTGDRIRAFSAELLERIENLPGVRAVGSINSLPLAGILRGAPFDIVGRPDPRPDGQRGSIYYIVGGSYFEAMGIPLLDGRFFGDADTEQTEPVFMIDEKLARRDWPGQDPVGQRISYSFGEGFSGEIIGVVGSVRHDLAADPAPIVYWWFPQAPTLQLTIIARTEGDPNALAPVIAAQVTEIDPNQPVAEIRTMHDVVSADIAQPRFTMLLLGSFAAAALLLAAIGLYGVIAFSVEQRTQEIGLRVALGAEQRDVLRLVMRQGLVLTGMGLGFGLAAALAVGRVVAGLLYGVAPTDSTTLVAVSLFLAAVALLATYLPARRAARVDPMIALRAE